MTRREPGVPSSEALSLIWCAHLLPWPPPFPALCSSPPHPLSSGCFSDCTLKSEGTGFQAHFYLLDNPFSLSLSLLVCKMDTVVGTLQGHLGAFMKVGVYLATKYVGAQ